MTEIATTEPRYTETGLELPAQFDYERWRETGHFLGRVHRANGFWIGDWYVEGEKRYGHEMAQAVDEIGLSDKTIRNYAWVAERVPLERRREDVTFSHHAEVAALAPAEQDALLEAVASEGLSVAALRKVVRPPAERRDAKLEALEAILEAVREGPDADTALSRIETIAREALGRDA